MKQAFTNVLWLLFGLILIGDFVRARYSGGGMYDLDILLRAAYRYSRSESPYPLSDRDEHTKPPALTPLIVPLTYLPREILYWIWGIGVIAFFFAAQRRLGISGNSRGLVLSFSLLAFLLPEVRGGQTNVLCLLLLLLEMKFKAQGLGLAVTMLLKPTHAIFAAFFLGRGDWQKVARSGLWLAAFFLLYGLLHGPHRLWADHWEWLHFLSISRDRHLLQFDNLGIPAVIARFAPQVASSWIFTVGAFAIAFWLGTSCRRSPIESRIYFFGLVAWISVVLSPMAWLQNYLFLMPLLAWILSRPTRAALWLWGAYFFATQLINHDTVGRTLYELTLQWKLVLIASAFVVVAAIMRRNCKIVPKKIEGRL